MPQKKLLEYRTKWLARELTDIDEYLLFLATLHSTDLIHFRVPAVRTEQTPAIVANNLEALFKIVGRFNYISNPSVLFPQFVIGPETKDLANVRHWIEAWNDRYETFRAGKIRDVEDREDARREAALERLVKNPHRPPSSYAAKLADWAKSAGSFPKFTVTSPLHQNTKVSCADYWAEIIERAVRNSYIFEVPDNDLSELVEHCEQNIPIGTIYSYLLRRALQAATKRKSSFIDLGDADIASARQKYGILRPNASVEDANLQVMVQLAPTEEPMREHYPSKLAFLKAKVRYQMAVKYSTGSHQEHPEEQS